MTECSHLCFNLSLGQFAPLVMFHKFDEILETFR